MENLIQRNKGFLGQTGGAAGFGFENDRPELVSWAPSNRSLLHSKSSDAQVEVVSPTVGLIPRGTSPAVAVGKRLQRKDGDARARLWIRKRRGRRHHPRESRRFVFFGHQLQ